MQRCSINMFKSIKVKKNDKEWLSGRENISHLSQQVITRLQGTDKMINNKKYSQKKHRLGTVSIKKNIETCLTVSTAPLILMWNKTFRCLVRKFLLKGRL